MPPAKKKSSKSARDAASQQTRLWLMYPPKLIQQPLIWQLTHKFPGHRQHPPGEHHR